MMYFCFVGSPEECTRYPELAWLKVKNGECILHGEHPLGKSLGSKDNLIPLCSNDENSKLHAKIKIGDKAACDFLSCIGT